MSEKKPRGRPRLPETEAKINVSVRLNKEYWEQLDLIAKDLGLTRTGLLTQIAQGKIQVNQSE